MSRQLDDDALLRMLADVARLIHDEGVEATTQEDPVTKNRACPHCGTADFDFYPSAPYCCKGCFTTRINAHIAKINEESKAHASNHRQPWSELEVEMLMDAVAEGMHAKDVAEMLGRTYLSVHAKLAAVRKLLEAGEGINYATFEITTTTTTTTVRVTRPQDVCPVCHVVRPCFCE